MHRRHFLKTSMILGGALSTRWAHAGASMSINPFQLGIASGDMTSDSVVLWTRLAPEPQAPDGGISADVVPIRWQLALDPDMTRIVRQGEKLADASLAHSVHVDVRYLEPGRDYWYRFIAENYESPVGHTKTLPVGGDISTRFVTTSCQNYTHGYFVAYRHMVEDAPDFVVHLGDYIYDTSFGETFRKHETEKRPESLLEFRRRHALYKSDEDLQHAHAQLPFFTVIDNHDAIEDNDPSLYAMRAAAYQAWYEHMPVRGFDLRTPNQFDMVRHIELGDLMQINLLDTRQFRDTKDLCRDNIEKAVGFGNYRERCADLFDEKRSMLGEEQETTLYRSIRENRSTWNVIASSGPILPYRVDVEGEQYGYIGSWDAYPANRRRLANAIDDAKIGDAVILSGDLHSFWAMDGYQVTSSEDQVSAVEFVSSSISANWPPPLSEPIGQNLDNNPHVAYYEGNERGYLLHDVDASTWQTRYRAVGDSTSRDAKVRDVRTFRLEHGKQGLSR